MSDTINDQGKLQSQVPEIEASNEGQVTDQEGLPDGITGEIEEKPKKKLAKKKLAIFGAILVVAAVIAAIILTPSKFEKVKRKCLDIVGTVSTGKGYFTLDTYPDAWEDVDSRVTSLLLPNHQKQTLEAIQYANEALGFNGSLYHKMLETTALMGRQTEENSKYRVSWKYHPDDGLEVTYEEK